MSIAQRAIEAAKWALAEYGRGGDRLWGYCVVCHPDTLREFNDHLFDLSEIDFVFDRDGVKEICGARMASSRLITPGVFLVLAQEVLGAIEHTWTRLSEANTAIAAVRHALIVLQRGESIADYRLICHPDTKARLDEEWLDLSRETFQCDSGRRRVESVMGARVVASEVVPPRNFLVVRPETLKAMEEVEALMKQARSTK